MGHDASRGGGDHVPVQDEPLQGAGALRVFEGDRGHPDAVYLGDRGGGLLHHGEGQGGDGEGAAYYVLRDDGVHDAGL